MPLGKSPSRFDFAKLDNLNAHYIRQSADADLLAAMDQLLPHLANGKAHCREADAASAHAVPGRHAKPEGARRRLLST